MPGNQGREKENQPRDGFLLLQALRRPLAKPCGKQKTGGDLITSRTLVRLVRDLIALHGLHAGLSPQSALPGPGLGLQILPIFRARFPIHERHVFLERHELSV